MKLSIVVPAFNEERLLPESLRSIKTAASVFDEAGWTAELIVCDNNSTDRTAEIAAAAGATVVFEPINQISRARNAGAARARGDWLLFVDADSFPTRELFADLVRAIQAGDCIAGGALVTVDSPRRDFRMVVGWWNVLSRTMKWAAGSFIFCEQTAFREAGGFSLKLYASEEIALFRRLKTIARRRGRRIVILQEHALRTSARKAYLYAPWEHGIFLVMTVVTLGLAFRTKRGTSIWYDGRR